MKTEVAWKGKEKEFQLKPWINNGIIAKYYHHIL